MLVALDGDWSAALTITQDAVRVTFAVPWYDMLLLGTTDDEHEGEPGEVAPDPGDVDRILVRGVRCADGGRRGRGSRARRRTRGCGCSRPARVRA